MREICRQIARYQLKKLVIIDNYENNAYEIQITPKRTHPELDLKVLIVSVQNHLRIYGIFEDYRFDIVFHGVTTSACAIDGRQPAWRDQEQCIWQD